MVKRGMNPSSRSIFPEEMWYERLSSVEVWAISTCEPTTSRTFSAIESGERFW